MPDAGVSFVCFWDVRQYIPRRHRGAFKQTKVYILATGPYKVVSAHGWPTRTNHDSLLLRTHSPPHQPSNIIVHSLHAAWPKEIRQDNHSTVTISHATCCWIVFSALIDDCFFLTDSLQLWNVSHGGALIPDWYISKLTYCALVWSLLTSAGITLPQLLKHLA